MSTTFSLEMLGEKLLVCFVDCIYKVLLGNVGGGGGGGEGGGSEFQNPLFRVVRRKPCPDQYFTLVFSLSFITVIVSSHLCVICYHYFICGKVYGKVP